MKFPHCNDLRIPSSNYTDYYECIIAAIAYLDRKIDIYTGYTEEDPANDPNPKLMKLIKLSSDKGLNNAVIRIFEQDRNNDNQGRLRTIRTRND